MQIIENAKLKDYLNYKIGGRTPVLYILEEKDEINQLPQNVLEDAYILGGGTNILCESRGIKKPVIKIAFDSYSIKNDILDVDSGMPLNHIGKIMAAESYETLVSLSGIPGTIGGAIYMNAGSSHGSISDNLISTNVINRKSGEYMTLDKFNFGFRKSIFNTNQYIIISAKFLLKKADKAELIELFNEIKRYRLKKYPSIFPSVGCCFKKPWGGNEIIKKIGMVGKKKDNAVVSPMFPSFILNIGGATSSDIKELINEIKSKAEEINESMPLEIIIWDK